MVTSKPPLRPARVDTDLLELKTRHVHHPQRLAVSRLGMVATAHYEATRAGVEILAEGGNAIDAAVAAAFALGVCEPAASGLGGQTMMLISTAGEKRRTFALDGSSRAPNLAVRDTLTPQDLKRGYRSTTVPATPAVLGYALRELGRLPLSRVLEPSVRLAEKGYRISVLQHALTRRELRHLQDRSAAQFFLRRGAPLPVGARLRQPVLAETLKRLAAAGIEDFYTGETARLIHEDMVRNDGLIRSDDLAQIPWPIERRPITVRYGPYRVFTFPPPGAGRTLVEMLNIYQSLPKALRDPSTPKGAVALADTIRRAFRDRRDRPFDAQFYAQVSERHMLSPDYARRVARRVARRAEERGETTHLSVIDRDGNIVTLTQSIELVYGAAVATPDLGFLYNDYMGAFDLKDPSHPYSLRPNAAPWASVAPTIVFKGHAPWLAIGSPGSERITPAILQVLLGLERGLPPLEAVAAPRLFCNLDGLVRLEASRMRSDVPPALERAGFEVERRDPFSFYLGCVQAVLLDGGELTGVADPRRDGSAGGPDA